jgi:hypothetical protein
MALTAWRLLTIMLAALSMGVALCHLLELPGKMALDGALWLTLLQILYPPAFGTIGGFFEVGAVVSAGVLTFLVRDRGPSFGWTLAATVLLVASHAVFWIWVAPVNAAMAPLTPDTLPADWMELRDQWEYAHATRAVLQIIALGSLVYSALVEVPTAAR